MMGITSKRTDMDKYGGKKIIIIMIIMLWRKNNSEYQSKWRQNMGWNFYDQKRPQIDKLNKTSHKCKCDVCGASYAV